jgi:4-hydroxy-L-threonine phosphate dehydrogenase PdxA
MKPVIGILLGDGAGIGPEIVAKLFSTDDLSIYCRPVIIGDRRLMDMGKKIAKADFPIHIVNDPSDIEWNGDIPFIDQKNLLSFDSPNNDTP